MPSNDLRVLIAAEHASAKFGGEAALPLHYFRVLRKRGVEAWLVVHERTRTELIELFAEDIQRIYFVPDTTWHIWMWRLSRLLPGRLSYFTVGFAMRLLTQILQRRIIQRLIQQHAVTVIHQPMPVSPKEPSMVFGLGVPVIIGPMNGGMNYPPAFGQMQGQLTNITLALGRLFSNGLNFLIPGKHQAAILLVANQRTQKALPNGSTKRVIELVENGVDLSIWNPESHRQEPQVQGETEQPLHSEQAHSGQPDAQFVFVGRLVDWKAVDLLLEAFQQVASQLPVRLEIIGDGPERGSLEQQAIASGLLQSNDSTSLPNGLNPLTTKGSVHFAGWLSQVECAKRLQQSDVLVLPSLLECGGAVVLEAMAMSMPVIATNWGGPADYLDSSCGILVEPTSREALIQGLADAMTKLATLPELRSAMGKAGRQRVVQYFDWEAKGDAILKIYREAMELPTNRRSRC